MRVLTAVLTTLLTPLHQPSNIKDECHRETFDGPEHQAGENVLAYADRALKAHVARNYDGKGAGSFLALHSHPSLLKLHEALKRFSAERGPPSTAEREASRGTCSRRSSRATAVEAKHALICIDDGPVGYRR